MHTTRPPKSRHIATTPIDSSAISAIGHDPQTNTLRIQFKGGGVYDVTNVSAQEHQALTDAASPGSFYHQHFRGRTVSKVDA